MHRLCNRSLIGFVNSQAVNGVSHYQRWLGRIDNNDGFAAFCTAHLLNAASGGSRKLVDIFTRTRPRRLTAHGRHNFAIGHALYAADSRHHRDSRLTPTGHHVDVHCLRRHRFAQIDRRHTKWPNRCWSQIDHNRTLLVDLATVFRMDIGRCCVKANLYTVRGHRRQHAVYTVCGSFQTHV